MNSIENTTKQRIIQEILDARKNRPQFLAAMKQRQEQGFKVAKYCAEVLKQRFGVEKVVLFGSLLDYKIMNWHSDIDLAVWGLPEENYFQAVGILLDIAQGFSVDLVEFQYAKPHILTAISEGCEL
jgi:predicted nucleotidyltransferase